MRAIVWTRYGPPDVLQLDEVAKPTPKDKQVLIRIYATAVTAADCELRSLRLPIWLSLPMRIWLGFRKPRIRIPGSELAGEIESVGQEVKRFKKGDQVFGSTGLALGAYAEYTCMPENPEGVEGVLATKPANLTYEQAAAVPLGGLNALHFLRKGNIHRGEKVLIYGAGGSIGTFAVQLARYFGAEVTAVDSTEKLDMLRSIGADQVIDYTKGDFTTSGETYDVIFDVVGKSSFSRSVRSLKQGGRYLLANPGLSHMIRGPWVSMTSGKKIISGTANVKTKDLVFLQELIEGGMLKPVIDRCYPLEQIADAHRYVETGYKKGNVAITMEQNNKTHGGEKG